MNCLADELVELNAGGNKWKSGGKYFHGTMKEAMKERKNVGKKTNVIIRRSTICSILSTRRHGALLLGNGEVLQPLENPAPPTPTPSSAALRPILLRRRRRRSLLLFRLLPPPPRLSRRHLRRAHRRDGVGGARAHQAGSQKSQRKLLVRGPVLLLEPRAPRRGHFPVLGRARRVHLGSADDAEAYDAPRRRRRGPGAHAARRRGRGGCSAPAARRRARRRARVRVEHAARAGLRAPRRERDGGVGGGRARALAGRRRADGPGGVVRGRRAAGRRAPADAAAAAAAAGAGAEAAAAAGGRPSRGAVQRVRAQQQQWCGRRVGRGRRGEAEREELAAGEDLVGDAHVGRVVPCRREAAGREYAELEVVGGRRWHQMMFGTARRSACRLVGSYLLARHG